VAPGNAGTAQLAHNVDISPTNVDALLAFARDNNIDLTVVGPEAPLAEGLVDLFKANGMLVFGPSRLAAQIEASKVFSKQLMQKYNIPCARSQSFSDYEAAKAYIQHQRPPIVVKADGLAAGKGVVIAESVEKALEALADFMQVKTLGAAGEHIVVEEFLTGKEMSAFAITDGYTVVPLAPACDYKRVFDGDKGPNTGGMGSYSPPYFLDPILSHVVKETIMEPTVKALRKEGRLYKGVLYGGLMVNNHSPKVLEFNARFGDPETQVVLPRLKTDLLEIILAVVEDRLHQVHVEWSSEACVGVVMASGGYPGNYRTGFPITGLNELDEDVMVFHAGTKPGKERKEIVTSGGRVLTVVAMGATINAAREKVYNNIARIHFEGAHYRKDIALIRNAIKA
jgi:phosphoribosylamine--glycine ligase